MDKIVDAFVVQELRLQVQRQQGMDGFVNKVVSVLVAEAYSNTFYQILSVIMVGDGTMSVDQALLARSIYVVLVTLLCPFWGWFFSKREKGHSFLSVMMDQLGKICPVLIAWGWKDWASQLDTWAGPALWDELIVALVLTVVVVGVEVIPFYRKAKARVAAGGDEDTILMRIVTFPCSLALMLGYIWNSVASYPVGKIQDLEGGFEYKWAIQSAYTIVAAVIITNVTVQITKRTEAKTAEGVGITDGSKPSGGLKISQHFESLVGDGFSHTIITTLSFIYAWAVLDTMDDWSFGVMNQCASYSSCSPQANFSYSVGILFCFSSGAFILQRWSETEPGNFVLCKAIHLQTNAMIMTVGWAWMNFYTVWTAAATKKMGAGGTIWVYVISLFVVNFSVAGFVYLFHGITTGLEKYHKSVFEAIKAADPGAAHREP